MFIKKNEPIIVGVSGGPDSMFLLNDLINQGYRNIIACHVNYNYRIDSLNDQNIVEEFCEKNNVTFELKNIDKKTYSSNNLGNFESFARNIRYDFFCDIAKKYHSKYCFIAHNLNDSIETYIIQKQRNSLVEHYGLNFVSEFKNLTIVRPLLNRLKSEILQEDKLNNIPFAIDSTNSDTTYKRNKIRSELNENDFNKYKEGIKLNNLKNEKLKTSAKFYANNYLTAKEMRLNREFFEFDTDTIMWILIEYFKLIKKDDLFFNRSKNTLREIALVLKNSQKKFIKIKVGDQSFIRDYDRIYFVEEDWFKTYEIEIKSKQDLDKLKILQEWVKLEQDIDRDGFNFPYLVTNDYEKYKLLTTVRRKKTNRYFIDKKIPYKVRFQKPVVINLNRKELINIGN